MTAIIRVINDPEERRRTDQYPADRTSPKVTADQLTGTLVGNEESIDKLWRSCLNIDWARNAVKIPKSEEQKSGIVTCSVGLGNHCSKVGAGATTR